MTSNQSTTGGFVPRSPDAVRRLLEAELAVTPRLGYVALLLVSVMMTVALGTLWLTEPSLPLRAHAAFAVMVAIGTSWSAFAMWVLTRRRVLFPRHGIVAGRMAVTFTSIFTVGAFVLAVTSGGVAFRVMTLVGLLMVGCAVLVLVRAHRHLARLLERKQEIEKTLDADARRSRH
jgi:hypothetical protein